MANSMNALQWPPQAQNAPAQSWPTQQAPAADNSALLSQAWHQSYAKNAPNDYHENIVKPMYEKVTAALHSLVGAVGVNTDPDRSFGDISGDALRTGSMAVAGAPGVALSRAEWMAKQLGPTPVASDEMFDLATPEEKAEYRQLQQTINEQEDKRAKAQKDVPKSLFRAPDGSRTYRQDPDALTNATAPHDQQIQAAQSRMHELQSNWNERQVQKSASERPYAETASPGEKAILANMPAVSGVTGAIGGMISGKPGAYVGSGLGGALEGAIGGLYPTYRDLKLPPGSPGRIAAENKLSDPRFWATEVAPEVGAGVGMGLLGTYYGQRARGAVSAAGNALRGAFGRGPASPPPTPGNALAEQPENWGRVRDANGRHRWAKGHPLAGRFAPAPDDE